PFIRSSVSDALTNDGHRVILASDASAAMTLLGRRLFDLVVIDSRLSKIGSVDILCACQEFNDTRVLLIAEPGGVSDSLAALNGHAYCLNKPIDVKDLLQKVADIGARQEREVGSSFPIGEHGANNTMPKLFGRSRAMVQLKAQVDAVAHSQSTVLI